LAKRDKLKVKSSKFKGSRVQRFKSSKVQRFNGSIVKLVSSFGTRAVGKRKRQKRFRISRFIYAMH